MLNGIIHRFFIFISVCFSICFSTIPVQTAHAQSNEEMETLSLFYNENDLIAATSRHEKPVSYAAENTTIINSDAIEMMNAHILADVLYNVTGIQISTRITPGLPASLFMNGSDFRHVLIMMDEIPLNNLSDNIADIGALSVQNIERIEIIKGPASSAWGSSLGGLINIITKMPKEKFSGAISGSYGEKNTSDYRAEISGKKDNLGYYLNAGQLQSDGLRPHTDTTLNNLYGKVTTDLSETINTYFSFWYSKGDRGLSELQEAGIFSTSDTEYVYAAIGLNAQIFDNSKLNLSFSTLKLNYSNRARRIDTDETINEISNKDKTYSGKVKFVYLNKAHTFVIGGDIDNGTLTSDAISGGKQKLRKWAIYANDTIYFKNWTLTPGLRHDYTSTNGNFLSPSIGVTYNFYKSLLLKASLARGFSAPPLSYTYGDGFLFTANPELKLEKTWSYQAGMEADILKHLKLKASIFRQDVRDEIVSEKVSDVFLTKINKKKTRKQGLEIDAKTVSFYNTSLSVGFVYIDTEDALTDETIKNIPKYTWDIGIEYKTKNLKAIAKGHYIWWNMEKHFMGKYTSFIWDLNLIKTIYRKRGIETDIFLNAHNLFDGSQYPFKFLINARRWLEAGIRVKY